MADQEHQKLLFSLVKSMTGISVPPEEQTPTMRALAEQLTQLAILDVKTRLPNTLAMDSELEKTLAVVKSHEAAGNRRSDALRKKTFIMIDLDGFKAINDNPNIGHAGGDAALKYFADFMKKHLRPSDTVARMGGDEFGVLMEADETAAKEIMGRLRKQLATGVPFEYNGVTPPLSFSFGAHEITAQDTSIDAIKKDADDKAYVDKAGKHERLNGFAQKVAPSRQSGGRAPAP